MFPVSSRRAATKAKKRKSERMRLGESKYVGK